MLKYFSFFTLFILTCNFLQAQNPDQSPLAFGKIEVNHGKFRIKHGETYNNRLVDLKCDRIKFAKGTYTITFLIKQSRDRNRLVENNAFKMVSQLNQFHRIKFDPRQPVDFVNQKIHVSNRKGETYKLRKFLKNSNFSELYFEIYPASLGLLTPTIIGSDKYDTNSGVNLKIGNELVIFAQNLSNYEGTQVLFTNFQENSPTYFGEVLQRESGVDSNNDSYAIYVVIPGLDPVPNKVAPYLGQLILIDGDLSPSNTVQFYYFD